MNAAELNVQLLEAASAVREAQADLEQRVRDFAKAERQYRLAKSTAFLSAEGRNATEREAKAEAAVNELRYQRDLAEGLKVSALEAVRTYRGLVSAVQTLARLYEQEAAFDRTGPQEVA